MLASKNSRISKVQSVNVQGSVLKYVQLFYPSKRHIHVSEDNFKVRTLR